MKKQYTIFCGLRETIDDIKIIQNQGHILNYKKFK